MKAKITNVILIEEGESRTFFTLEGVEIGGFLAGKKQPPKPRQEPPTPKGGVVKALTGEQLQRQHDLEADKIVNEKQTKGS